MQFFDQNLGYEIEMPDGIDPTEANQAMAGLYRQEQARQSMMQGLGWAGRTIADVMTPQRTSPVVDYRAAAAMSPQAFQNTMQMQQGSIDQENRVRAQQQMQQEQMAQMNYIEQARMRQRNAEMLQQQKDQRDMMKIRQQDYDMRQKEHEFNMRMKEDEIKEKERQAKMPQLHESSGMQYTYDEKTNSYKGGVVPGAEAVNQDYTRAPQSGGGGKGSSASGMADTIQVQDPETKQLVTVQKFNPYGDYIDTKTGKVYSRDMFKGGTAGANGKKIHSRFTGEDNKEYILWQDGTTSPVFPEEEQPTAPPVAQPESDGFFSGLAKTAAGLSALKQLMGGRQSAPTNNAPALPQVGMVEDGYKFLGGDPADPKNWEKI